ncbi:MAG: phage tail tape measure protein [Oscillospiraceae bacterium]
MNTDGTLIFGTGIDNSGFESGISTLQVAAGNAIGNIAADMVSKISDAVAQIPTQMIAVGSGFEASMSQVAATMGITSAATEFDTLSDAAKEMGETTKFSASQAGEALNYLALAGYDAEKAVSALPTVLNVAAAGGMELAAASDMITDAMSALGLETSQMADFSDKLAVTAQKSNTSVSQLGEAILTVGGTAKNLAGGVTEMNTVLGILADNGIKGAEGGTALRNVILSLTAPTSTAAKAIDGLGLSVFDNEGKMRNLQDIIYDLNDALGTMTDAERSQALSDIFNKVDLKSVNALLGTSAERFDELSGYIDDCSGAAADMAATMDDNLKGDLTIMQSALEGLGIAAYEKFQTPLRDAVQSVTEDIGTLSSSISDGALSASFDKISNGISNIIDSGADLLANDIIPNAIDGASWFIDNFDNITTVAGAAAAAVVAYEVATNGATIAQTAFNLAANANPYALLASAIVGVVTAVGLYVAKADAAIKTQEELQVEADSIIAKSKAEADITERKAERYRTLYEQYKLTGEASLEMKLLAEELQDLAPDSIRLIDEETGAYNELDDSINNVIESLRRKGVEEAKQNMLQGHYNNITNYTQKQVETERQYMEDMRDIPAELLADFEKQDVKKYFDFFEENPNDLLNVGGQDISPELFSQYLNRYIDLSAEKERTMQALKTKIEQEEADIQEIDETFSKMYGITPEATAFGQNIDPNGHSDLADYYRNQGLQAYNAIGEVTEELQLSQEEMTAKLKEGWQQAEHDYAIGVIGSEEDLIAEKQRIWNEYGDESCTDHWQYYENLIDLQNDYADEIKKANDQLAKEQEEAVKAEWKAIEYQNNIGLLSDEEAYEKKLAFIQKYCPEYSNEWYSYYKNVYDYQQAYADKQFDELKDSMDDQIDVVKDGLKDILSEYQSAYKDIQRNIDSFKNKLLSLGDAFTIVENKNGTKTLKVNDLSKQMEDMRKYTDYGKKLKAEGASQSMLKELTSMDAADGMEFAKNLANMSDTDFAQINDYYKQRDELAQELAEDLYSPDVTALNEKLVDDITEQFGMLPEEIQAIGAESMNAFIEGLGAGDLSNQVESFIGSFGTELDNGLDTMFEDWDEKISESIGDSIYEVGKTSGEDFVKGFNEALAELEAAVTAEQAKITAEYSSGTNTKERTDIGTADSNRKLVIENKVHTTLEVDGKQLAETVTEQQNIIDRGKGK